MSSADFSQIRTNSLIPLSRRQLAEELEKRTPSFEIRPRRSYNSNVETRETAKQDQDMSSIIFEFELTRKGSDKSARFGTRSRPTHEEERVSSRVQNIQSCRVVHFSICSFQHSFEFGHLLQRRVS